MLFLLPSLSLYSALSSLSPSSSTSISMQRPCSPKSQVFTSPLFSVAPGLLCINHTMLLRGHEIMPECYSSCSYTLLRTSWQQADR